MAILNHPFLHLFAIRKNRGFSQSRLFLQQTVDQVLYHAGWVVRLVRTCKELQFEISNPLVGRSIMATATIPWLLQFSEDAGVSKKATKDLTHRKDFLLELSSLWPHLSSKVRSKFFRSYALQKRLYMYPPNSRRPLAQDPRKASCTCRTKTRTVRTPRVNSILPSFLFLGSS